MSNASEAARYREAARYVVELHWRAPRTWGERNLPRAGRFYAWALFESPRRKIWTYAEATASWVRVVLRQRSSQSSRLKSTRTSRSSNAASPSNYRARALRILPSLLVGGCSSARWNQLEERPGRCSKSIRLTHGCSGPGGVATCTGGGVVGPNLVCAAAERLDVVMVWYRGDDKRHTC